MTRAGPSFKMASQSVLSPVVTPDLDLPIGNRVAFGDRGELVHVVEVAIGVIGSRAAIPPVVCDRHPAFPQLPFGSQPRRRASPQLAKGSPLSGGNPPIGDRLAVEFVSRSFF